MNNKRRILFLCTGNSCRSQMAEAIVNYHLGDQWEASSTGTKPAGYVHPLAIRTLEEIGIEHQGRTKHLDEFRDAAFDRVITVCDDAAENCPLWPGSGKRTHIGFPDPAKVEGTEEEKLAAFRQVRDSILERILPLLRQPEMKDISRHQGSQIKHNNNDKNGPISIEITTTRDIK